MTKTELQQKHPILLKPEGAALIADIATHARRGTPMVPPNVPLDRETTARKLGVMEGWQYLCEYLHNIHVPERQQEQAQEQPRPYSQPQVVVKDEEKK